MADQTTIIERLVRFTGHANFCSSQPMDVGDWLDGTGKRPPCRCGLDDLLRDVRALLDRAGGS